MEIAADKADILIAFTTDEGIRAVVASLSRMEFEYISPSLDTDPEFGFVYFPPTNKEKIKIAGDVEVPEMPVAFDFLRSQYLHMAGSVRFGGLLMLCYRFLDWLTDKSPKRKRNVSF